MDTAVMVSLVLLDKSRKGGSRIFGGRASATQKNFTPPGIGINRAATARVSVGGGCGKRSPVVAYHIQ
jgi:hypothetical protein